MRVEKEYGWISNILSFFLSFFFLLRREMFGDARI